MLPIVTLAAIWLGGCKKAEKVVVPDLSGQDVDQAQKALVAAKLKAGSVSGGSGAGAYVLSETPAAGQQVDAGTVVNLVADMPVPVPSLTGGSVTDAVIMLQGAGLRVSFIRKPTVNPFAKPTVEQQDPPANSMVRKNTMVTLQVSTSPDFSALLGLVAKEPAYQNLKPEYKRVLDAFMGNPSTPRSMDPAPTPGTSAPAQ